MKKVKVVVVVEGGNVQSIFTNQKGVEVVQVDYDVDGREDEGVKRVGQFDFKTERVCSFELASVRHFGEADVDPKEIRRFFRNAVS